MKPLSDLLAKPLADLFYKVTSRKLWIWLIVTHEMNKALTLNSPSLSTFVWVWGGTTLFYFCGDILIDSFSKMIEKAEVKIALGAQASVTKALQATGGK